MTLDAVRAGTKTETRRRAESWKTLRPGDRLALIEKGMGLRKGERQVIVRYVEITEVDVIPLAPMSWLDVIAEGLEAEARAAVDSMPESSFSTTYEAGVRWFFEFWLTGHGHKATDDPSSIDVRRIRWRYIGSPAHLFTPGEQVSR